MLARLHKLIGYSGKSTAWLTTILVLLICLDVVLRYLFSASQIWMTELEWHLFAIIFLIGAAYTFQQDAHVRVDLFYTNYSEKGKAWINLLGILLFLIPWTLVLIRASNKYAYYSFRIGETSPDPGGLPGRWLIKYAIVIAFVLLFIQGVLLAVRCIRVILGREVTVFESEMD